MQKQGDLAILKEPTAVELLQSAVPARLAYNWSDGTPRVVPIWFHWTGDEIIMVGPPAAPRTTALKDGTTVALCIDYDAWPARSLTIRGTARCTLVVGEAPEYVEMTDKYLGSEAVGWRANYAAMFPQVMRIAVRPEWAGLVDLGAGYLPGSIIKAMAQA